MKYVLLFCGDDEDARAFAALPEAELKERYGQVGRWFAGNRDKIGGTNQLQPPETSTCVRFGPGGVTVTDGPYMEGKEQIGGYAEIDVADLDEALEMAKTWPGRGTVEIRPVMTMR
jgi:hypothetical protein